MNMLDYLEMVLRMPKLYVGEAKLSLVWLFIRTMLGTMDKYGVEYDYEDIRGYFAYVKKKCRSEREVINWVSVLLEHCKDEEKAIDKALKLLQQYRKHLKKENRMEHRTREKEDIRLTNMFLQKYKDRMINDQKLKMTAEEEEALHTVEELFKRYEEVINNS